MNEPSAEVKNDRLRRVLTVCWVLALLSILTVTPNGRVLSIARFVFLCGLTAALIGFALRQLLLRRRYGNSVPILRWMLSLTGSLALISGVAGHAYGVAGAVLFVSLVALLWLAIRDTVARMRARRKPPDRVVQVGVGLAVAPLLVGVIQGPPAESAEVTRTLDELATNPNPDYCATLMSARYLHQVYGGNKAGLFWCRDSLASRGPHAVNVFDVRVADDHATAEVTARGGDFNGSTLKYALIKQRGYWRLDELLGFRTFDRAKFEAVYRRRLLTGRYRFPAGCRGLRSGDLEELLHCSVRSTLLKRASTSGRRAQLAGMRPPNVRKVPRHVAHAARL